VPPAGLPQRGEPLRETSPAGGFLLDLDLSHDEGGTHLRALRRALVGLLLAPALPWPSRDVHCLVRFSKQPAPDLERILLVFGLAVPPSLARTSFVSRAAPGHELGDCFSNATDPHDCIACAGSNTFRLGRPTLVETAGRLADAGAGVVCTVVEGLLWDFVFSRLSSSRAATTTAGVRVGLGDGRTPSAAVAGRSSSRTPAGSSPGTPGPARPPEPTQHRSASGGSRDSASSPTISRRSWCAGVQALHWYGSASHGSTGPLVRARLSEQFTEVAHGEHARRFLPGRPGVDRSLPPGGRSWSA